MYNCGNNKIFSFSDYRVTSSTDELPVSLTDVKTHLKISGSGQDDYLTLLINSASDTFEKITNRYLITKTITAYLDDFPCSESYDYCNCDVTTRGIVIKKSQVQSITSIKYYIDDVLTTWTDTNYYITDSIIYPEVLLTEDGEYPSEVDDRRQAVQIIFTAGYGTTEASIPDDIQLALMNHVAFLYENRGDCGSDGSGCPLPCVTKLTYERYKIPNLIAEDCC